MLLASDERRQIARLFNFLLQGEQLAQECAERQVSLFTDPASRRFLQAQARQEALHVRIFKAGIGILAPRGIGEPLAAGDMAAYRALIESALSRGDCCESLLGMQVILEGLGDVTLTRISRGFVDRNLDFRRVRQLVVGQEDAHHLFGVRRLQSLLMQRHGSDARLGQQAEVYLEVIAGMLITLKPFFEYFEEDADEYLAELQLMLPDVLQRAVA